MAEMKLSKLYVLAVSVSVTSACVKHVNECNSDSDCHDVAYPFCDVMGEYGPSGGESHVCTIVPTDCPVDRCGCSPGATTCAVDQLSTCNADGKSLSISTCSLGCSGGGDRCLRFVPSNGLGPAMTAAAGEPSVVFPGAVTIDTDLGTVKDNGGVAVPITTLVVSQPTGDIRVFIAGSIDISDATTTGSKAFAFVAPGPITIRGRIQARALSNAGGSGSQRATASCGGHTTTNVGGGGGNSTPGGKGQFNAASNVLVADGGIAQNSGALVGGCDGGPTGNPDEPGGGGGGAMQFSSADQITVMSGGAGIDVGAGGSIGGGGSGGLVIFEAPQLTIDGTIVANGGGGGACGLPGTDASASSDPAPGVVSSSCTSSFSRANGGTGGTRAVAATDGAGVVQSAGGSGGGSVGRLLITTTDGNYISGPDALISAAVSSSRLVPQ